MPDLIRLRDRALIGIMAYSFARVGAVIRTDGQAVQAIRDGGRDDSGIELAEKTKKQQLNLKPLTGKATTAPEIWAAVLAA